MEIGQHRLHHFEFKTPFYIWIDEKVGSRRACHDGSRAAPSRVFESSNRGGAYGDDSTRRTQSLVDGESRLGGNEVTLGMNSVILDALDADGLKSSQAHMQRYLDGLDSALPDSVEDFRSEMEAGGGGGDRAVVAGVDGLVVALVGRVGMDPVKVAAALVSGVVQDDVTSAVRATLIAYLENTTPSVSVQSPLPFGPENYQEKIRGALALTLNLPVNQLD